MFKLISGQDRLILFTQNKAAKMKHLLILVIFSVVISCNEKSKNNVVTIQKDDMIIKGSIVNDSIFNDTILYYNLKDNLLSKKFFKNGSQEGISIEYYLNGKPMIIASYNDGLKNGYNSYFDSSKGICFYKDFYYYGLPVGPIMHFDSTGGPKKFFFINLQNETLLTIDYRSWKGIDKIYENCINFTSNIQKIDSSRQFRILLYLINPPNFSFKYSILKKKRKSGNDFVEVKKINNNMPFENISLPELASEEQYSIGLNVFDSLLNKETVIYKDL
jgi:antitoxin component YwqK of YwqJK toxin-antitoxin module